MADVVTKTWRVPHLWTPQGWRENIRLTSANGVLTDIAAADRERTADVDLQGPCLPGLINAHSHAFQYAMAGEAEFAGPDPARDDFWSWRQTMYHLALTLTPEHMQVIAERLYMDLLEHGYTSVVEFHYLHHDRDGRPYTPSTEMSERLLAAANAAGLPMTLAPMHYQKGGFDQPPTAQQRRFLHRSVDAYLAFYRQLKSLIPTSSHHQLAAGAHSLRACPAESLPQLIEGTSGPFHMHISEQVKEVEESIQHLGVRPVRWVLDHISPLERLHLVHATHLDASEVVDLAHSPASVVLCPSTEANLGDGLFPLVDFMKNGGRWSIGSDSHVSRCPFEELRWLDYGQRLLHRRRTPLCSDSGQDAGEVLFSAALRTGSRAAGLSTTGLEIGAPLNLVELWPTPWLSTRPPERWLSTLTFSGEPHIVRNVYTRGIQQVAEGRHIRREDADARWRKVLSQRT